MEYYWDDFELIIKNLNSQILIDEKTLAILSDLKRPNSESNTRVISLFPLYKPVYIADNELIDSCDKFDDVIKYYKNKPIHANCDIIKITEKSIESFRYTFSYKEYDAYKKLLSSIIIDIKGVHKTDINFSPSLFNDIMLYTNSWSNNKPLRFLIEVLSLIAICDKVVYDEDSKYFIATFKNLKMSKEKSVKFKWKEYDKLNNVFYQSYLWIIKDILSETYIDVKRDIVRSYITSIHNINDLFQLNEEDIKNIIMNYESVLRIIIEGKSEEYFKNRVLMKEEYVSTFSKIDEVYNNAVKRFVSLLIAIAAGLYGIIFANGDIIDFKNTYVKIVLSIFLIAEFILFIIFIIDWNLVKKYREKIKSIYIKHLFINTEEWDSYLETNEHCLAYWFFISINIILIILTYIFIICN